MNSRSYDVRRYLGYPICLTGSMINYLGQTAFGTKKAAEFFFGPEKNLSDMDMSTAFAIFLFCTFNTMRRTRLPRLHSHILEEHYNDEGVEYEEEDEKDIENQISSPCCDRLGNTVAYALKFFGYTTILTNSINSLLTASTLYSTIFPSTEIGEDLFALCVAATSIGMYVKFNISQTLIGAENTGKLIQKGAEGLHIKKDKKYYLTIGSLTANAITIPFMAYLSSRHALPKLPLIGSSISDNTNLYLSIFSSFIFLTTRTCTVAKSTYDFFAKPRDSEWDLDKLLTYASGFGDSIGTSIGTLVAFCHLLKEGYGYFVGPVEDPDNFWDFNDFIKNFGWGSFSCGITVGVIAGFINFVFSSIQGLEKAKKIEQRLKPEFQSRKWLPQGSIKSLLFSERRSLESEQHLLSEEEKTDYNVPSIPGTQENHYVPPSLHSINYSA